ncbi:hypothetical protein [Cupriavidus neocaledonicus]|uniref:Uncharacterized protein n=1 Tax=Cupriavidus neocaledonicus TaxID=1040979 RepID=A0A375H4J8_9BURK|nr:hypothetical protein [Cupriavidus neocaledonicus]SOZ34908.1 conserved hypothetical protein [Cupriavidus neocaledonicus]SPD46612.1 conserved protein of unknown function [Cupriavidus neocaledonicus]
MEEKIIDVGGLRKQRTATLPERFAHLSPIAHWSLPTETERNIQRHRASMEEIHAFADAMLGEIGAITAYLDTFEAGAMPAQAQALMNLLLSLAEVAPAIEFYRQQAVIDGFDPRRFVADETFKLSPAL